MKAADILNKNGHRSWPIPGSNWQWYQEWNDVVFIHGSVDEATLKEILPKGVQTDTVDGKAWVSVVIFKMEKVRHRYSPSFPPVSDFYEINIRTYVTDGKLPGVYFLSMEGGKRFSSWIAKKYRVCHIVIAVLLVVEALSGRSTLAILINAGPAITGSS